MKNLLKIFFVLFIVTQAAQPVMAQQTKSEKKATKEAAVKALVESKSFVFEARFMYPNGGGQRYLNSNYDLTVGKDTIVAYLPYFGVAYSGAGYTNSDDNGIKFTSTKFDYQTAANTKGGWRVVIKPTDSRTTTQMIMAITPSGNADLTVISRNRQQIRFDGFIEEKKKDKDK